MERWRLIEGFDGYEVSNHGRVRSWKMRGRQGVGKRSKRPKLLVLRLTTNEVNAGYLLVHLSRDGVGHNYSVHRLVAKAFLKPPTNPLQTWVNHKDGDKARNHYRNLEWSTPAENSQHRFDVLGHTVPSGEGNWLSKAVIATNVATGEVLRFAGQSEAARAGFDQRQVSNACRGRTPTHAGYRWQFANEVRP